MIEFQKLEKLVKSVTKDRVIPNKRDELNPSIHGGATQLNIEPSVKLVSADTTILHDVDVLNVEQQMAYSIIANHLAAHMAGRQPRQLLMMVIGQDGTGKSTLSNTITASFKHLDASHLLAKTALSGVAASLIGGITLHWFGGLPIQRTPQSDVWPDDSQKHIKAQRKNNILPPLWLAIDEMGMCTPDLLTLLSQVAGKVKVDDGKADATVPFGGLNVLIMGDFHQFPPVGGPHIALYRKLVERNTAVVGKAIYLQFDTVVKLHRQWHIDDEGWMQILQRSQDGECTTADLREIRKLIVTNPECEPTDFTKHPWNSAVLVTPRNCVRNAWNRAAL
jgi:hypothetical protein